MERDGRSWDTYTGGRLHDRFERRNGEWKIAHRRTVFDWNRDTPANEGWCLGYFDPQSAGNAARAEGCDAIRRTRGSEERYGFSHRPTIKLTVVVALPPMFSVANVLRALDLVVAGRSGHLLEAVERHAHAGRADRVAERRSGRRSD